MTIQDTEAMQMVRGNIFILLSIVLILGAQTVFSATVLYQDDFNDGDAAGWTEYDGSFSVSNGVYVIESTSWGDDARSVVGDASWFDYVIEVDFNSADSRAAVLFRIVDIDSGTDEGHYYQFHVFPESCGFCEMSNSGGFCNRLDDKDYTTTAGEWHHIAIFVRGSTAKAYMDNNHVISFSELGEYSGGGVGLKSINGLVTFKSCGTDLFQQQ
jgi:hypothetical protein